MKVKDISLKGWKKDNGTWSWMPDVVVEYDSLDNRLTDRQREDVKANIADLMALIRESVEQRSASRETRTEPQEAVPASKEIVQDVGQGCKAGITKLSNGDVRVRPIKDEDLPAPVEPLPEERRTGDEYDAEKRRWNRCVCGNSNINFISTKTGKAYQACKECHVFLQENGKVNNMGEKK